MFLKRSRHGRILGSRDWDNFKIFEDSTLRVLESMHHCCVVKTGLAQTLFATNFLDWCNRVCCTDNIALDPGAIV